MIDDAVAEADRLIESGQAAEVVRLYERDYLRGTLAPELAALLACAFVETGSTDRGIELASTLVAAHPDSARAHFAVGYCRLARGEHAVAEYHLAHAARLDPGSANTSAAHHLANHFIERGDYERARAVVHDALADAPSNVWLLACARNLAFHQQQTADAASFAWRAFRAQPNPSTFNDWFVCATRLHRWFRWVLRACVSALFIRLLTGWVIPRPVLGLLLGASAAIAVYFVLAQVSHLIWDRHRFRVRQLVSSLLAIVVLLANIVILVAQHAL